ncbi:MAG: hypothetical protein ACXWNE_12695, partial [Candidatus Binataceae bacterium]
MEQHSNGGRAPRSTAPRKRRPIAEEKRNASHKGKAALDKGKAAAPHKKTASHRAPLDARLQATPEELESIRVQLDSIEQALSALFGADYRRGPESRRSRRTAADIIDRHFDQIVADWTATIRGMLDERSLRKYPHIPQDCANALIRFIENLRDRDNL